VEVCGLPGFGVVLNVGESLVLSDEAGVVSKFWVEHNFVGGRKGQCPYVTAIRRVRLFVYIANDVTSTLG